MKAIKISLVVIVVGLIAFFAFKWWVPSTEFKKSAITGNPYIDGIQQKIDLISQLPDSKFCKDAYDNIIFEIDQAAMPQLPQHPYGRFGKSKTDNEQQKEILIANLYSVYSQKFINQALYVFQNSSCNLENLNFVKSENIRLKSSLFLESGSYTYIQLSKIENIISMYDEVLTLINNCKYYSPPTPNGSGADSLPIMEVSGKITQAKVLLEKLKRNPAEFNCTLLQTDLREVPQWLFNAHVIYLNKKIEVYKEEYKNYPSYDGYMNSVGNPLNQEIENLISSLYEDVIDKTAHEKLKDIWDVELTNAYNWIYP